MKKLFVLLLALACVGFVFAQDEAAPAPVSSVAGYVFYSSVLYDQDGGQAIGPSWLDAGHYQNITLKYDAGVFGFSANWEFENNAIDTPWRDYTAWVKPFGDMVKVSAGKLRNGDYRLTSYIDGNGFNSRLASAEYGALVQVYPMAGLSAGVSLPIAAAGQKAADMKFGFGAAYTLTDIAKVVVMYRGMNDEIFVGADVKAVPGLTAKLGFAMKTTELADYNFINATAGYGLMEGALDLGLDASYKMAGAAKTNTLYAKVNVAYTMGTMTPSAYATITNKDVDGTATMTEGFGAQVKFAAGDNGALYLGVDVGLSDADPTWSIPLPVEVAF